MKWVPKGNPLRAQLFVYHESVGLILLALMTFRLIWMLINVKPHSLNTKSWERFAERSVHYSLYFIILLQPISGWVKATASDHVPKFFNWFSVPAPGVGTNIELGHKLAPIHYWVAWLITAVVSMHILAALKHHFIDKDNVLKRMLRSKA